MSRARKMSDTRRILLELAQGKTDKIGRPTNNKKRTRGRNVQVVELESGGTKLIRHYQ